MAVDSGGNGVVAWSEQSPAGDWDVVAQRLDALGNTLGEPFEVNTYTEGDQYGAVDVATAPDGGFVIVWESDSPTSDGTDIQARFFDDSGQARAAELLVNTQVPGEQTEKPR